MRLTWSRPAEGVGEEAEALQQYPGACRVAEAPLHHLAAAQRDPDALGSTLCRRVGQSSAPMASECSGIRSGCGCERHARQAQALITARHRLFGQGLEASAITASARRNPAGAVAGNERESASWESGNLGSCRAFADSPGCQDSRFSVPRPGGDLGGRDRGRRGSGCAGRHACPPECPRRARAGGGHGLPHGPAARVPGGAREVSSLDARAGACGCAHSGGGLRCPRSPLQ